MDIAFYTRVSTEEQNLERQIDRIQEYTEKQFDEYIPQLYKDKATGTETTERKDYQKLMDKVKQGNIDAVIVKSVSRLARSIRDLDRTAEKLKQNSCELHIIDEGLIMKPNKEDPYQKALFRLLGVFAELEADITQQRVKEGIAMRQKEENYHHGPAPLGFNKKDGRLVEADNYDQVIAVLDLVDKDELSKRKAARELDTSRKTINRCLDRKKLYGLN